MLARLAAVALAKTKGTAIVALSLAAGGVGGAVALSHVAPAPTVVASTAASSSATPSADPEVTVTPTIDPEATGAPTADPEASMTQSPETGSGGVTLPPCPAGVKSHGHYVSSVAHAAPRGKDGQHGTLASAAGRSDCGKKPGTGNRPGDGHPGEGPSTDGGSHGNRPSGSHHESPKPDGSATGDSSGGGDTSSGSTDSGSGRTGSTIVQPSTDAGAGTTGRAHEPANGHGKH